MGVAHPVRRTAVAAATSLPVIRKSSPSPSEHYADRCIALAGDVSGVDGRRRLDSDFPPSPPDLVAERRAHLPPLGLEANPVGVAQPSSVLGVSVLEVEHAGPGLGPQRLPDGQAGPIVSGSHRQRRHQYRGGLEHRAALVRACAHCDRRGRLHSDARPDIGVRRSARPDQSGVRSGVECAFSPRREGSVAARRESVAPVP